MQLYVTEVGVQCPDCSVKFISKQMPVLIDTGYRNSELRQDFKGAMPQFEQFAVTACPNCGRSDWVNNFPGITDIEGAARFGQPNIAPHIMFRAAANCAERLGRDFFNIGLFYLHAAWCADDDQAVLQSKEYRMLGIRAFSKSLADGTCPFNRRIEIEYLIGELYRRAGEFERSLNHFRQVMPKLSSKFAIMARKLMRLAEAGEMQAIDFEFEMNGR